jgi:hypothetical protein
VEAPKLFALLDELQAALDCRPFHKVSLMSDMNAGVVQIPRLGIFGWHRNYLVVGLPLMQSMAPDEFKAVLAHEFAHSSRRHGQFGNWLYRVRRTWAQIFEQMTKRRSRLGAVWFRFLNWFWPVFNGHAFVLARANEYEADACSVRLAGPAAAQALIRLQVDGMLPGEKFWPDIVRRANHEVEPPAEVILALGQALKAGPTPDETAVWMRRAFLTKTNNADTHPCLKDRLQAMGSLPAGVEKGIYPERPATPSPNAAEFFLGDYAITVARKISDDWKKLTASQWKIRHERTQKIARELATLEQPADAPPTPAGLWERVLKIIELQGHSAAPPLIRTCCKRY